MIILSLKGLKGGAAKGSSQTTLWGLPYSEFLEKHRQQHTHLWILQPLTSTDGKNLRYSLTRKHGSCKNLRIGILHNCLRLSKDQTDFTYAGATAVAVVMLVISFVLLLVINALQAWQRKRTGTSA